MPAARPHVVVFDVNETLSDMTPLAERWESAATGAGMAALWFAQVLRDGFALAAAGSIQNFSMIAEDVARRLLVSAGTTEDVDAAVSHILDGFAELDVHPDVPEGVRALHQHGFRLATLSNGAASVADTLLSRAGVRDSFEQLLSVQDAGRWKPAPEAYRYALDACGVDAAEAMLVAVHPWDVDGAARTGLQTAWLDREHGAYPSYLHAPDIQVRTVAELAQVLSGRR